LDLESARANDFDETDVALFQSLAAQIGAALENARLFKETQTALGETEEQARRLATLNEMSEQLALATSLDEFLDIAAAKTGQILEADRSSVAMLTPEGDFDVYALHGLEGATPTGARISGKGRTIGKAVQERRLIIVPDDRSPDLPEIHSSMVAPLIAGTRVLGTLNVGSKHVNAYTQRDGNLLLQVSSLLSSAIANRQLFEEARIRAEELAALNELAQALTAQLDIDQILEEAHRGASRLVDITNFSIGLYDPEKDEISISLQDTESEIDRQLTTIPVSRSVSGYCIHNRQSVLIEENLPERMKELGVEMVGEIALSWLGVPLVVGDRVLGIMTIQSFTTTRAYDEHDQDLMTAIASQVAIALQNASLFKETRTRAEELTVLNDLAQALTAQLNVDQVLETAYQGASRLLDTTSFFIGLYDEERREISFPLHITSSEIDEQIMVVSVDKGFSGYIVRNRTSLLFTDKVVERAQEMDIEVVGDTTALSWLGVPLLVGDRVLGVMAIESYSTPGLFGEHDLELMTAIASQTTIAMQNARLFEETRTRAEELAALNELAQALTTQLNVEQVMNEAFRGASRLLDVESFSLGLYDPEKDEIAFPMTYTESEIDKEITVVPASRGVSGYMIRNRTSVLFEDRVGEQQEELGIRIVGEVSQSWVGVPLIIGDRVLGVMNVQSFTTPGAYDEHDLDLLTAIGSQVAIALQNANLFEETEKRAAQLAASAEVARSATAILDVDLLLDEAVKLISEQFGFYHAGVFLVDDQNEYAILKAASSKGGKRMLERSHRLKVGKVGIVGYVAATGESRIALDVGKDAIHFVNPDLPDTRSEMGLPLKARERVIGVLDVQSTKESAFSEEDVAVLQLLTDQLATAIANANLFQRVREDANRRALVNEVNQAAASSLNIAELLARSGEAISRQNEMPCIIFEWDTEEEKALTPITVHDSAGLDVTPAEPAPITAEMDPAMFQAIRTHQLQVLFDVSSHVQGAAAELAEQLDLLDTAYIPLVSRDRVLGLLALGRQRGHPALDEGELSFLEVVATNLGVALENARLFQDAVETAQRLAEVDRLKSQFLANMSHELRTPLNSIIGFYRVILKEIDGPLTDMQRTDLETIYKSGQHLLGLINDVLEVSKIAAGKMELAFEDVDLQEIIKGVMSTAIALVKDSPIELQQSIAPDLPTVRGDARRLRQVIINLVGNAAKFTEEGFVRVEADVAPAKDGGSPTDVVIAVIDSGIGIAEDKIQNIFEAFTQVDASTTRRAGGTGLGLSICQSYVELHSGRMWVESVVGEGSTFYISLPIKGPPQPEGELEEEDAEKKVEEAAVPEKPTDEISKLVLCVEDDEGVITLFRRYLSKKGYQVVGLTDPTRVMEEAKRIKPHAITLDVMMPEKDGWEVIQELKADAETRHIPVIMCTIVSDKGRGISLGAADYLVKPIIERDLLAALDRLDREAGRHLVLVVDDQAEHRELLRRMIESQDGYEVVEAGGGQEAITVLQQIQPQIIMLDLMMPDMDGFDVLESVKADEKTRAIPIIIVTAKELTDEDRERLNHNVEALVQKGILEEEELLEDVATALKKLTRHPPQIEGEN